MQRNALDRTLPWLLAVLVIAAAFLLWRYHAEIRQRTEDLAGLGLLRSHQMLDVRIDAMFTEWKGIAKQEASAIAEGASEDDLIKRWKAVLHAHWPVNSVRLADELGNEISLHRTDEGAVLVRTESGSKDSLPKAYATGPFGIDTVPMPWNAYGRYDPRERAWFSKAIENNRDEPVWNERQFVDSTESALQVGQLIRRPGSDQTYRVLMMEFDLGRADRLDARSPTMMRNGVLVINGDGKVYAANAAATAEPMAIVLANALPVWIERKFNNAYHLEYGGAPYAMQVTPVQLNGGTLYAVIAMETASLAAWTAPERRALAIGAAILALFTALLIMLAWRGRKHRKSAGLLDLHARQLQHRLTKAMGERDVLSREVHHRVKNNLQVVSSLLNLQASSLDDAVVREEFLRGKRRIDTIALVHHRLYDQPDLRGISLDSFLSQLTDSISAMHGEQRSTVSISVDAQGLKCDQDTAIELGIIVCELVTNAYLHAFPHATGGHIALSVSRVEGDLHRLVVTNNGVPPQRGLRIGQGKLGLEIVEALAEQLDGSLHMRTDGQAAFEVLFRMRKRKASADSDEPESA